MQILQQLVTFHQKSPVDVKSKNMGFLQLVVTSHFQMSSLVVRFMVLKNAKFHKNSQRKFQMSQHVVKFAL